MTPREKIEQRAIDYSVEHPSEAPQLDEKHFKSGAEYGYNLAIENMVEWLDENVERFCCDGNYAVFSLLHNLKEAMKL